MSRRKHLALRKPCGRLRPAKDLELLSPTETRRLLDAAAAGLRDQPWGTAVGQLYIDGRITSSQFAAAKRWAAIVADYSIACRSPPAPRALSFDTPGGSPIDPDSEKGERERLRHERATALYLEGRHALHLAGLEAERVVDHVCARDQALAGFYELSALRAGLQALSTLWSDRRKARALVDA